MENPNSLLEAVPCDLCGCQNEEFLYTKRGVLTNHPFRVVKCRSCGLIYLNPRLCERAVNELYDGNYYNGKGFDAHVNYITDFKKQNDVEKLFRPEETVKIVKEIISPPAALLDFGCGLGDFMRQATNHGFKVEGYEVSRFAAEFAGANGFKVYQDIEQLPREKYDIVTAIEVLEHSSSPMKVLSAIYKCLKVGGILYYSTANFDGYYRKWRLGLKDNRQSYIQPEGHIYFFSTQVMRKYFKKIGYSKAVRFEPSTYEKEGGWFRLLSKFGFIESSDAPRTLLGKLAYYGARNTMVVLGRRHRRLPLAIK